MLTFNTLKPKISPQRGPALDFDKVSERLKSGKTVLEVATELDVTVNGIYKMFRRHKMKVTDIRPKIYPRHYKSKIDWASEAPKMVALFESGVTVGNIAKKYRVTPPTIVNGLKVRGIDTDRHKKIKTEELQALYDKIENLKSKLKKCNCEE